MRGLSRHGAVPARRLPAHPPAVGMGVVIGGPNGVIRRRLGSLGGMVNEEVIKAGEPGAETGC